MNKFISKIAFAATLTFSALSAHADYTFSFANNFYGTSINDSGMVAGRSANSNLVALWDGTTVVDLPSLPNIASNIGSYALDINNSGQVAGLSYKYEYGSYISHATLWSNGTVTDLGKYGLYSSANGINDSGKVVGTADSFNGSNVVSSGMIWNNGVGTKINVFALDINNAGQILGDTQILNSNGSITNLGTVVNSSYTAYRYLNDLGRAAGTASVPYGFYGNTTTHAVLWNGSRALDLGTLSANDNTSFAAGINNLGQVVGNSYNSDIGDLKPVLWNGSTGINVNSLLANSLVSAGWVLSSADDINNVGTIVGTAYNTLTGISGAYTLSPVPEADTSAMLLMGAGLMGFMARRRKQAAA